MNSSGSTRRPPQENRGVWLPAFVAALAVLLCVALGLAASSFWPTGAEKPPDAPAAEPRPAGSSAEQAVSGVVDVYLAALSARDVGEVAIATALGSAKHGVRCNAILPGLIDDSFSFSYNSEDAFGFSLIGAETDEPEKLAEEILLELHRARKGKLKQKDLERSKRKRLGKFIRSFDTPDGAAFLIMGCVQRNVDLFQVPQVISKLSSGALERRLRDHFDEQNYAVSILSPKK